MHKSVAKIILTLILLIFSLKVVAAEDEYSGIGAIVIKDRNKVFILKVLSDSPAHKALLQGCTEIIQVNGERIKKYSLQEIIYMIRGKVGTTVKLLVKQNGKKRTVELRREKLDIQTNDDERFITHWKQVAPADYKGIGYVYNSKKYSINLQNGINYNNYWENRKTAFKNGYNACLSYTEEEQNGCLMNLVNREIQKTAYDRQAELQEQIIINQNQMNSNLNNINNSIQQQNTYLQNTNMRLFNINNSLHRY